MIYSRLHPSLARGGTDLFSRSLAQPFAAFDRLFQLAADEATSPGARLATGLYQDDEAYYARIEIPGVPKDELSIELAKDTLTIERRSADGRSVERRALRVPDEVEADRVSAALEHGILTITLPKAEAVKPRTITVS
jgi:HSP20 family protein